MTPGTLHIVATPIGNLEDITLRALRILKEVDLIAAEDTRHSRKLLNYFGIETPLTSCHEHNEEGKAQQIIEIIRRGQSVALISDAGTPAISDPGFRLVRRCRELGISVTAAPGVSALVTALSIVGLPCENFIFSGFLPSKKMARQAVIETLRHRQELSVFYESPHRLLATLEEIVQTLGVDREVAVARELTKLHEEIMRGAASEVLEHFRQKGVRGEIVLLVSPGQEALPAMSLEEALLSYEQGGELAPKEAVKQVAAQFGIPAAEVYQERLRLKKEGRL